MRMILLSGILACSFLTPALSIADSSESKTDYQSLATQKALNSLNASLTSYFESHPRLLGDWGKAVSERLTRFQAKLTPEEQVKYWGAVLIGSHWYDGFIVPRELMIYQGFNSRNRLQELTSRIALSHLIKSNTLDAYFFMALSTRVRNGNPAAKRHLERLQQRSNLNFEALLNLKQRPRQPLETPKTIQRLITSFQLDSEPDITTTQDWQKMISDKLMGADENLSVKDRIDFWGALSLGHKTMSQAILQSLRPQRYPPESPSLEDVETFVAEKALTKLSEQIHADAINSLAFIAKAAQATAGAPHQARHILQHVSEGIKDELQLELTDLAEWSAPDFGPKSCVHLLSFP